jgi:hypothetical protein
MVGLSAIGQDTKAGLPCAGYGGPSDYLGTAKMLGSNIISILEMLSVATHSSDLQGNLSFPSKVNRINDQPCQRQDVMPLGISRFETMADLEFVSINPFGIPI